MTLQELHNALAKVKKGQITKVHYITTKGAYTKETETTIRFVEYSHINGVNAKGKVNPNETYDNYGVIYNKNTNKFYLQMATIETNHKAKVKYFLNNVEITKEQFEQANPSKPRTSALIVFRKDIADIISIG